MIVGQPAAPATRAAIGGDNCAIYRFSRLYFKPELASIARHIGAAQRLGHQSFMTGGESVFEKAFRQHLVRSNLTVRQMLASGDVSERLPAAFIGLVDQ